MLRIGAFIVLCLGLAAVEPAHAQLDLYNCKDKDGKVLLTNQKSDTVGKECKVAERVSASPPSAPERPAAKSRSPANFPKESSADRAVSKSNQRTTLERELSQEELMLGDARKKLAEQEAIRTGDEKNYARVIERLKPYQDTVEVHQKNVEALKRELSNLGR